MEISNYFILLAVMVCLQVCFVEGWKCPKTVCGVKYKAVGCYKDDGHRPLPTEILNERDPSSKVYGGRRIDWHDWDNYMEGFACRCAAIAKKKGYKVFGLQFYGECWSGPGLESYKKVGKAPDKDCVGVQYKPCEKLSRHCVGKRKRNFVYEIVPDCDISLEPLGCFKDQRLESVRPLPDYYLTDRDSSRKDIFSGRSIDWRNWDVYMPELVCRCAKKAKKMGRAVFGVQYYGECWTGANGELTYDKDGETETCVNRCFKKSLAYQTYGAGQRFTNFVYRLGDASCELKTSPKGCFQLKAGAAATLLLDEIHPDSPAFIGQELKTYNWDSEFPKFLCRCAREARRHGYSFIEVQKLGMCYGGYANAGQYKASLKSSECKEGNKKCSADSKNCAGDEDSLFVYQIAQPVQH